MMLLLKVIKLWSDFTYNILTDTQATSTEGIINYIH